MIKNTNWMKLFGTFCELVQVKYQVHLEPIKLISNKIHDCINILSGPVSIEWRFVNCYLWNYYQIHSNKMDFFYQITYKLWRETSPPKTLWYEIVWHLVWNGSQNKYQVLREPNKLIKKILQPNETGENWG